MVIKSERWSFTCISDRAVCKAGLVFQVYITLRYRVGRSSSPNAPYVASHWLNAIRILALKICGTLAQQPYYRWGELIAYRIFFGYKWMNWIFFTGVCGSFTIRLPILYQNWLVVQRGRTMKRESYHTNKEQISRVPHKPGRARARHTSTS